MIQSLALRSDVLAMRGLSEFVQHPGYIAQRTPAEPDYWMGNQLILSRPDHPAKDAFAAFDTQFPAAAHKSFVWDVPGMSPDQIDPAFAALGCDVDTFDTLALSGDIAAAPTPDGIVMRSLKGDADWDASFALQMEIGIEEGRPKETYSGYARRRNHARRQQIADGLGAWFGAFDGDRLVAQMGMFHDQAIARYQHVETRKSHRRRGICAALLRHSCLWALGRAPSAKVVIVAQADSAAGRLYRRMGFAHAETLVEALKRGY